MGRNHPQVAQRQHEEHNQQTSLGRVVDARAGRHAGPPVMVEALSHRWREARVHSFQVDGELDTVVVPFGN